VKLIIPGDSVKIITKVPCDNFELIQENGRLTQSLKVVNGILSQRINIKPDTLYHYVTNTEIRTNVIKVPEKVKYVPRFWKITGWIGMGSILALIAFLFVKFKRLI
jgi:hypothetical protein